MPGPERWCDRWGSGDGIAQFAQRVMIWKNAAVSTRTPTKTSSSSTPSSASWLDRYFHITERGSTISREVRGGIVTFFSMSYILVLNPAILSKASPPGPRPSSPPAPPSSPQS